MKIALSIGTDRHAVLDIYGYIIYGDKYSETIEAKLPKIADKHAPIRTERIRSKNSPWITSDFKKRMHDRDIANIKAIHSTVLGDWDNFKRLRNIVNKEIKLAKGVKSQIIARNAFMQHNAQWQFSKDMTDCQ